MKYFFSFSDTLHSFFTDKVTLEQLAEGSFVFSTDRAHLMTGHLPSRLVRYNTEKSNAYVANPFVTPEDVDPAVNEKWKKFFALVEKKDKAGQIIWQKRTENYPRKIAEFLAAGNEVFWNGAWQKLDYFKWLSEEKPAPVVKKRKTVVREERVVEGIGIDEFVQVAAEAGRR